MKEEVQSIIYTEADLVAMFKVTTRTIDTWVKNGFLPKPIKFASKRSPNMWYRVAFDKWFAQFNEVHQ